MAWVVSYQSLIGSVWHVVAWGPKASIDALLSDDDREVRRVRALALSILTEVGDGAGCLVDMNISICFACEQPTLHSKTKKKKKRKKKENWKRNTNAPQIHLQLFFSPKEKKKKPLIWHLPACKIPV